MLVLPSRLRPIWLLKLQLCSSSNESDSINCKPNTTVLDNLLKKMKEFSFITLFLYFCALAVSSTFANSPPTLYVQRIAECVEGSSIDISTIRIDDVDVNQFTQTRIAVNISVIHGHIYLPLRSGLFFNYGNIVGPDSRFEIIGKLSDIQKSLSHVRYLADPNYYGEDKLELSVVDMHLQNKFNGDDAQNSQSGDLALLPDHSPVTAFTTITVLPENDAPVVSVSMRFLTCDQQQVQDDGTPALSTASFSATLSDADILTGTQMESTKFQLSLTTRFGSLRLSAPGCDAASRTCTLVDTLDNLNKVTTKVTYTPDAGYNKFLGNERIGKTLFYVALPLD